MHIYIYIYIRTHGANIYFRMVTCTMCVCLQLDQAMKEVSRYISSLRVAPAAVVAAEEAKAEKGEEEQEESKSEEDKRKKEEALQRAFENKVTQDILVLFLRLSSNQVHAWRYAHMLGETASCAHKLVHRRMRA
jgi:hypothetical protein